MSKILKTLAQNIRRYAGDRSYYEISKTSGVSQSTLSKILAGDQNPTIEVVAKIADSLNVTASDLLSENQSSDVPADIARMLQGQPPHVLDTVRTILSNLGEKKKIKTAN